MEIRFATGKYQREVFSMENSVCAWGPGSFSVTPISCLRGEVMLTMHEIVGAQRDNGYIVTAHLGSWTTTTVTIDLMAVTVSPLSFSLPPSLSRFSSTYPLGSCIPRTRVAVAYAVHETRASRRLDARFHGYGIAPSLREMSPILLDYVAGFPLRFHRRRIISRECSPPVRPAFDRILHPGKER